MTHFADDLMGAVREKKSVVCAGFDVTPERIPAYIAEIAYKSKIGKYDDLSNVPDAFMVDATVEAIYIYNVELIRALHDVVPVIKPNMAFYETFGPKGLEVLQRVVNHARSKGLQVILDGKRNDIGPTAKRYADEVVGETALLDREERETTTTVFDGDATTLNPYLGIDGVQPFLDYVDNGKGVFVLARTSNKSAADMQDRLVDLNPGEIEFIDKRLKDSKLSLMNLPVMERKKEAHPEADLEGKAPLYVVAGKLIDQWGEPYIGQSGYSSVGAVVGATYPIEASVLRKLMKYSVFLLPGYGAQGGGPEGAAEGFDENGMGAVVNNSRALYAAWMTDRYKNDFPPEKFADAARQAAIDMRDEINTALEKAGKVYWE
ncbi:MAG: orotidine-5'-phosphate decarboxylase [Candidatus Aenigmatarchaeota archaeon]